MIKVYIASPFTKGNKKKNIDRHLECANQLIDLGFSVYAPLLWHFFDMRFKKSYDYWLQLDLDWLKMCDCVLRLPGESKGADIEEDEAKRLCIPIYYSIQELWAAYRGKKI